MSDTTTTTNVILPYVNLNGNSKNQLLESTYSAYNALKEAKTALWRNDISHGRNGMNEDHRRKLQAQRLKHNEILDNLITEIAEIFNHLHEQ